LPEKVKDGFMSVRDRQTGDNGSEFFVKNYVEWGLMDPVCRFRMRLTEVEWFWENPRN
jgi:hypothetical protein